MAGIRKNRVFHRLGLLSPRFSTKLTACGKLSNIFVIFFIDFSFPFICQV
jgi:hypothetical protein